VKIVLQHYAGARSLYIKEGRQDKGRKTAPRAGARELSHVRTPPPVCHVRTPPPVCHVRSPPPVRHIWTPIILTPLRHFTPPSPSFSGGTSLPTSVVERKSSTAWLHRSSAGRSRIYHRFLRLPLSFPTSAHKIFCCPLHLQHSLKSWSICLCRA